MVKRKKIDKEMKIIATEEELLKVIASASETHNGLIKLRNFILNYYYNEDHYVFDEFTEEAFAVLSPYLEMEEAIGDDLFSVRMKRLIYIVKSIGWTKEGIVGALYYDDIIVLNKKNRSQVIDKTTYQKKIRDLTPVDFDITKLAELIDKHKENLAGVSDVVS